MSQIPENNPDGQQPPGYYGRPGPGSQAPAQPETTPVLSEFDHLFRDSAPDTRRSVSQDGPVVRFAAGNAPAVQYPNLNPVPPQWPAPVGGPSAELAPVQNQQTQYPAQYEQYVGQEQQQYQQQYPELEQGQPQQYQQYQAEPAPQQYEQTQYLAQPQAPTQAIEYQQQYQPDQQGGYAPAGYQSNGGTDQQQWSGDGGAGGGKSNRTKFLVAGGAVVVVIGLIVALNSGGSGGTPKKQPVAAATATAPTAAQQAAGLMALVSQSGALRSEAISAVDDLTSSSCSKLSADQTSLQATSKARAAQASSVAKLDVTNLPNGPEVVADLAQAWTASATSDAAYARIAGDLVASGTANCKSPSKKDTNYAAAVAADGDATRAKTSAASLWNSDLATAAGLNLAQINANQL